MGLATAKSPYIALGGSDSSKTTKALGWIIADGGRDCPPPAPKTAIVSGIPYLDGDIDLTAWDGKRRYEARKLSYTFANAYDDDRSMAAGMDALTAYLASFLRSDLYDSIEGCTFHSVSMSDAPDITVEGLAVTVKATFSAAPYKTNASGKEVV